MSIHTVPGPTGTNDTANFSNTMTAAAADIGSAVGPQGAQGYVHVNAGTYRVSNISIPSNLRLEFDPAVIIQQPSGSTDDHIFTIDAGGSGAPRQNVTIIGKGNNLAHKENGMFGRQNSSQFVANMDPASSGGNPHAKFLDMGNCSWVRLQNIYFVGNWNDPTGGSLDNTAAHITCHSNSSSINNGPYYHPRHIFMCNMYAINQPIGFGLTQLTSGENIEMYYIYERGGIPVRMETDFGANEGQAIAARLGQPDGTPGVTAQDIICDSGRTVATFSPHHQINYNCNISGIYAWSCQDGIRISNSTSLAGPLGQFVNSGYANVTVVAGPTAQRDGATWTIGKSKDVISFAATTYTLSAANVLALQGSQSTDGRTLFSVDGSTGTTLGATGYTSTQRPCSDSTEHRNVLIQGSKLWMA